MFRAFVLVTLLLIGIAASQDHSLKDGGESKDFNDGVSAIEELKDVEELENFNAGEVANLTVTLLEKALLNPPTQTLHYHMGQRHYHDRLVGTTKKDLRWGVPHDVNTNFAYPPPNQRSAAQITYVEITVHQTSNIGRAYVISGGVNQRHITIDVEAKQTYTFDYEAFFYGI